MIAASDCEVSAVPITKRAALAGFLALAACNRDVPQLPQQGGLGQKIALPNGGIAWLSRFDLTKTVIEQIALATDTKVSSGGVYYPNSPSPAFERLDANQLVAGSQTASRSGFQAIMNCSFFETYTPQTQLSFPIKRGGVVITGGSSPNGPREKPKDARYKDVVLKAMVWNKDEIKVADYDHVTGGVLKDANYPDGLVTYDYRDHPAIVVRGDPPNKYQLMAPFASKAGRAMDTLFVLTILDGTMGQGAAELVKLGVSGTILTVDGGPSTFFWDKDVGEVIATPSKTLPHYLSFRARTS